MNVLPPLEFFIFFVGEDDRRLLAQGKDVRTVAVDLGGDVLVHAVGKGDDCNHRGNSNNHADQREDGTKFIRPKRLQSNLDGLEKFHEITVRFCSGEVCSLGYATHWRPGHTFAVRRKIRDKRKVCSFGWIFYWRGRPIPFGETGSAGRCANSRSIRSLIPA